jgi:hypothetical protein
MFSGLLATSDEDLLKNTRFQTLQNKTNNNQDHKSKGSSQDFISF